MATDSSTLAWKLPWTEEPGRQQSIGLQSRTDGVMEYTQHVKERTVKPQIYWTAFKSQYLFSLIFITTHLHFPHVCHSYLQTNAFVTECQKPTKN